jgi:hypothetical protein
VLLYFHGPWERQTVWANEKMHSFGMSGRSSCVYCFDVGLAIHDGPQKRTCWRAGLYATGRSSGQNGFKTNARHLSEGWNDDAVRRGFAKCDYPAIPSVASVSNEKWIEESAHRQKDRDNFAESLFWASSNQAARGLRKKTFRLAWRILFEISYCDGKARSAAF